MTTEVKVVAHPGSGLEVVIVAIDEYDGKLTVTEQKRLQVGEFFNAYATDTRTIQVLEVKRGAEVRIARLPADHEDVPVVVPFVRAA